MGIHKKSGKKMIDAKSVLKIVYGKISENLLFGDILTSEQREYLVSRSLVKSAEKDSVICQQGEPGHEMYLIVSGEVEVRKNTDGKTTPYARIGSGELFGEVAALYEIPRTASVVATKTTAYLEIPVEVVKELMEKEAHIDAAVKHRSRHRALENALRSIPCLACLEKGLLDKLQAHVSIITFKKDQLIIGEGNNQGGFLYIILSGKARVFSQVNGIDMNTAILKPGDSFGDKTLMASEHGTESVAALTDLHAVAVSCDGFLKVIGENPQVKAEFESVIAETSQKTGLASSMTGQAEIDTRLKKITSVFLHSNETNSN
jgi:CRP-like cAMP-binding protein